VMDRLGALRTWMTVVTLVSLVALGIAVWAFLDDNDRTGGRDNGARSGAVAGLEQRIDALEARKGGGVSDADLDAVRDENAALSDRVDDLAGQVAAADDAPDAPATAEDAEARQGIAALDSSVKDLDARVQALEEQAP
jgi:BMFP domain-containing protein YqiC